MTTTAWADLPNAAHIDRVIASLNSNFKLWTATGVAWCGAHNVAQGILRTLDRYDIWTHAHTTIRCVQMATPWNATVWYAILALIAYDDCAYMLDSEPDELAILAALGDNRAIILLPACKVFHSLKTIA